MTIATTSDIAIHPASPPTASPRPWPPAMSASMSIPIPVISSPPQIAAATVYYQCVVASVHTLIGNSPTLHPPSLAAVPRVPAQYSWRSGPVPGGPSEGHSRTSDIRSIGGTPETLSHISASSRLRSALQSSAANGYGSGSIATPWPQPSRGPTARNASPVQCDRNSCLEHHTDDSDANMIQAISPIVKYSHGFSRNQRR